VRTRIVGGKAERKLMNTPKRWSYLNAAIIGTCIALAYNFARPFLAGETATTNSAFITGLVFGSVIGGSLLGVLVAAIRNFLFK
ncbi:MAG: hypothetical protein AAFO77_02665, partial [Pseudomonadota bacterium]